MRVRYIRDWQNGRTINGAVGSNCDWREVQAIDYEGNNIALGKIPIPSHTMNTSSSNMTDGSFSTSYWTNQSPNEIKNIVLDLGGVFDIDKLIIARANQPAICKETKTEVSIDGLKWVTIFDSSISGTYQEIENGKEFILEDDRLVIPNQNNSLNDIISFFEDFLNECNINKYNLKNILLSKSVEIEKNDKMIDMINKINDIKTGVIVNINNKLIDFNFDLENLGCLWDDISTLPYYFYNGCAVVLNNEIHILGSANGVNGNNIKHYKYDGNAWTSVSTLPYNFYKGCAVVLNNEIHILGGGTSNDYTKHYKYNGNSWTLVSTLPYYFFNGCAIVLNNEIHILGSGNGVNVYTKHYKYNGSTWTLVSTLPYDFYEGCATILNNEIHILRGTLHYKFDGITWSSVSTLPYDFYNGHIVVLNNEIHILGGKTIGNNIKHYKYNGNDWISMSTVPYNFLNGCAVVSDGEIHILGSDYSNYYTKHYHSKSLYELIRR